MDLHINYKWNREKVDHDPVVITLQDTPLGMKVIMKAPFFNDPPNPGGTQGASFDKLWNYEVVELFFLDSQNEEYLEVEFCPHGQHQILVLKGIRNPWKMNLPLDSFSAKINGKLWSGEACLPWSYFPEKVDKVNAFAIHGSDNQRCYEALHPVSESDRYIHTDPDFHRLQYFQSFILLDHSIGKRRDPEIWES